MPSVPNSTATPMKWHQKLFVWIWSCKHCDDTFRGRARLVAHVATVHHWPCEACYKNFRFAEQLADHVDAKHQVWEYCPHCLTRGHEVKFRTKPELAEHLGAHEKGELTCATCAEEFVSAERRAAHEPIHGAAAAEEEHRCPLCGKVFDGREPLVAHLRARDVAGCHRIEVGAAPPSEVAESATAQSVAPSVPVEEMLQSWMPPQGLPGYKVVAMIPTQQCVPSTPQVPGSF